MIPGIPSMGGKELLVILAIILLFFGAKRVPELGRSLGSGIREFRRGTAAGPDGGEEELEDRERKKEEAPSPGGAARGESYRSEAGAEHAEQKP